MSNTSKSTGLITTDKLVPVLLGLLVVAAFVVGLLWGQLQAYKSGGKPSGNQQAAVPAEPTPPPIVEVSVDDDPVLGSADAPVTIIEFSDYECPFCKRHFEETYPQLVENYINTGKVKLVFRDLPLPFHDPLATTEAIAANCAREQGDDITYFEYHDEIFSRTESNGEGLTEDDLMEIATDLGLSQSEFATCLSNRKSEDEVEADVAAGNKIGATGTPTFFIGKSTGDTFEAERLVGAQPYSAFEAVIDNYLE